MKKFNNQEATPFMWWASILITAVYNTGSIVVSVAKIALGIVGFVLFYELVGKNLFVLTVVTPIVIAFFYYVFNAYDILMDMQDDDENDDDWNDGNGSDDDNYGGNSEV